MDIFKGCQYPLEDGTEALCVAVKNNIATLCNEQSVLWDVHTTTGKSLNPLCPSVSSEFDPTLPPPDARIVDKKFYRNANSQIVQCLDGSETLRRMRIVDRAEYMVDAIHGKSMFGGLNIDMTRPGVSDHIKCGYAYDTDKGIVICTELKGTRAYMGLPNRDHYEVDALTGSSKGGGPSFKVIPLSIQVGKIYHNLDGSTTRCDKIANGNAWMIQEDLQIWTTVDPFTGQPALANEKGVNMAYPAINSVYVNWHLGNVYAPRTQHKLEVEFTCVRKQTYAEQHSHKGNTEPEVTKTEFVLTGGDWTVTYPEGSNYPSKILYKTKDETKDHIFWHVFSNLECVGHGDPPGEPGPQGVPGFAWQEGWYFYTTQGRVGQICEVRADVAVVSVDGQFYTVSLRNGKPAVPIEPYKQPVDMAKSSFKQLGSPPLPVAVPGYYYDCSDNSIAKCTDSNIKNPGATVPYALLTDGINSWYVDMFTGKGVNPNFGPSIIKVNRHATRTRGPTYRGIPHVPRDTLRGETHNVKIVDEKLSYGQIPHEALVQCAHVINFGALKYERDNWKKGDPETYIEALNRHLMAIRSGEIIDKDHGQTHAAAIMANAAYLVWFYREHDYLSWREVRKLALDARRARNSTVLEQLARQQALKKQALKK